mgnify:CR=1 FL=1
MNRDIDGRLAEIQETFIDLGGDLLALRTVAKAGVPDPGGECGRSCLTRILGCVIQHTRDIELLSRAIIEELSAVRKPLAESVPLRGRQAELDDLQSVRADVKKVRSRGRAALHLQVCPKSPRKTAGS